MARGAKRDPKSGDEPEGEHIAGRWASLLSRAGKRAGRLREAASELRRSPVLQHALAARERGNLEAAFWLLAEEFGRRPDDPEVDRTYWDIAVSLQRVDLAAPVGVELVQQHAAAGEPELAAQYWLELISAAPDALVSPTAIASILPELRRLRDAATAEKREELDGFLRRAMRHAVDPRNEGLHPGVALRLFEDGRDLNPEAARLAAEVALVSPKLHEAKRARLRAWLDGGDDDPERAPEARRPSPVSAPEPSDAESGAAVPVAATTTLRVKALSAAEIAAAAARLPPPRTPADDAADPEGPPPTAAARPARPRRSARSPDPAPEPAAATPQHASAAPAGKAAVSELDPPAPLPVAGDLKVVEAAPIALQADHLELRLAEDIRRRIAYPDIEAVCVVEVADLAEQPVAVIDLLLNWSRHGQEPLRVVRLRADRFDAAELVPGPCMTGSELASFLGELFLRTRAVPLPDPESALGLQLSAFESLERYEHEVLHAPLAS